MAPSGLREETLALPQPVVYKKKFSMLMDLGKVELCCVPSFPRRRKSSMFCTKAAGVTPRLRGAGTADLTMVRDAINLDEFAKSIWDG